MSTYYICNIYEIIISILNANPYLSVYLLDISTEISH